MHKSKKTKKFVETLTKAGIIYLIIIGQIILYQPSAFASWLVEARKFHISAHGQNSCQDCHEDIADKDLHPDPADVNRKLKDFFTMVTCLSCHDEVTDNLDEGVHGTKKVKDRKKYEYCLGCHQPHYQPRLGENQMGKFDPNRPRHEQCGACHEPRTSLPPPSDEDKACLACHRSVEPKDPKAKEKVARLCFHCHGLAGTRARQITAKVVPLINDMEYQATPHAGIVCTTCHQDSAQFIHTDQKLGDCRKCHLPHDEKVARDAHLWVTCGACHLDGIEPIRQPESKRVLWKRERKLGEPSGIHYMIREDDKAACQRCHAKGNEIGAVSMILPAKSILCMPCHAATFSVGDTITIIALIVFLAGLIMSFSVWLTGSLPGGSPMSPLYKASKLLWNALRTIFSLKIVLIIKVIFLDVLFQRRLYRQSKTRWLIHSLIFFPFVFRFSWGLVGLIASLWKPEWTPVWAMLDKNHPTTMFLFDLTGIMALLGVSFAFIRGFRRRPKQLPGLPKQDYLALSLIVGIVVIGFVLEGIRIAMTGAPGNAQFAFVGYWISPLFSNPSGLTGVYGYIWYIHAILAGAFVAYLPFSRLFHIIMGPVVLAMNAVSERGHG